MPPAADPDGGPAGRGSPLLPLFREIGDLKRIRSAGREGSIAARLFRRAWSALVGGAEPRVVALSVTAAAVAATRLADLDQDSLAGLGVSEAEALDVRRAGLADAIGPVQRDLGDALAAALATPLPDGPPPPFVGRLAAQPRAGVTCPGRPRIVLQPAESHAEHCLAVAALGVLLCPRYGAEPGTVFLAGLAHHLHNAALPDAGFTGETLLGAHLEPVMRRATETALGELAPGLRAAVEAARAVLPEARRPEGQAFHAADVLDRVLETEQHLRAASLTMDVVLDEMKLVHDGPVKGFHDGVLREHALLT